jgi:hypothetical protein
MCYVCIYHVRRQTIYATPSRVQRWASRRPKREIEREEKLDLEKGLGLRGFFFFFFLFHFHFHFLF